MNPAMQGTVVGAGASPMPRPRLFLIDTFGFLFRAFHTQQVPIARPAPEGQPIPTLAFPGYEAEDVNRHPLPPRRRQGQQKTERLSEAGGYWFRRKEENEY